MQRARVSREAQILGGQRTLRAVDATRRAGVSLLTATRIWRALGFPSPPADVYAFTERDEQALDRLARLIDTGVLTEAEAIQMTRAIGRSVDRMAAWQVQIVHDIVRNQTRAGDSHGEAQELAEVVESLVDDLEPLVVHAWRRHLVSAVSDQMSHLVPPEGVRRGTRTVGFVDMVGFTEAVHALDRQQVAHLVQRFEDRVSDLLANQNARLVKTLGDEVMFVTPDVQAAVALALDIVTDLTGEGLPPVRIGMATGPVVDRFGDIFGAAVNRASRLTGTGVPQAVVVDHATALGVADGRSVEPLPPQSLKGIGRTRRYLVRGRGQAARAGVMS